MIKNIKGHKIQNLIIRYIIQSYEDEDDDDDDDNDDDNDYDYDDDDDDDDDDPMILNNIAKKHSRSVPSSPGRSFFNIVYLKCVYRFRPGQLKKRKSEKMKK